MQESKNITNKSSLHKLCVHQSFIWSNGVTEIRVGHRKSVMGPKTKQGAPGIFTVPGPQIYTFTTEIMFKWHGESPGFSTTADPSYVPKAWNSTKYFDRSQFSTLSPDPVSASADQLRTPDRGPWRWKGPMWWEVLHKCKRPHKREGAYWVKGSWKRRGGAHRDKKPTRVLGGPY